MRLGRKEANVSRRGLRRFLLGCGVAFWLTLGAHALGREEVPARAGDAPHDAAWIEGLLAALPRGLAPSSGPGLPFSFGYGKGTVDELLSKLTPTERKEALDRNRTRITRLWKDPASGLEVTWEVTRFADFPAIDWVLRFANTGKVPTQVLGDIQALDLVLRCPLEKDAPYRLHRTNGAPANPTDFEPSQVILDRGRQQVLGGGGGRSSNRDFPFFKVETGDGSLIVAVGWSGQWRASLDCPDGETLRIRAGMERTAFHLEPGETVRSPRILLLHWTGDTLESNARFRRLIHEHYAARRRTASGSMETPLPILFSNTCFTRGGGWLNECNASNQISLINAYAPLGLQAVITDAGWFEGGWPSGAGNWTPRKDAYPQGMAPVAAAALERGMVYGLWFEPERVVAGTWIDRNRPAWVLSAGKENPGTCLLDMGNPEAREYFFGVVRSFMALPGFRVYRQDFNMDPLPYWRASDADAPGREGIREIRYIEGLYAFWDRIAAEWPDSIREECASGGRRIDLETIQRMHIHQESDYWFDDDVDQAQIWGLSQYLPNSLFTTPISRLDDYTFHSTLATSLCIGWIADDPGFDAKRARKLLDRYREVRHLLVGSWYPLLPYSRDRKDWMASQYHRPDLGEGMILALRRGESPYRSVEVKLHGLEADASYEISLDSSGEKMVARGVDLLRRLHLSLPRPRSSDLITYRKVPAR